MLSLKISPSVRLLIASVFPSRINAVTSKNLMDTFARTAPEIAFKSRDFAGISLEITTVILQRSLCLYEFSFIVLFGSSQINPATWELLEDSFRLFQQPFQESLDKFLRTPSSKYSNPWINL